MHQTMRLAVHVLMSAATRSIYVRDQVPSLKCPLLLLILSPGVCICSRWSWMVCC